MKNHIRRSSITGRIRAAIALVVLGMALTVPAIASAAAAPLSEFSPYVPPQSYTVGACLVQVGPLWDGSVGWASVGGMSGNNITGWNGFIHGSGVCGAGNWATRFWLYTPSTGWETNTSVASSDTPTPSGCHNGSPRSELAARMG